MVTARAPVDDLYHELLARAGSGPLPFTLRRIGDCEAPSIIAAAVHAGHLYARTLDAPEDSDHPLRHERIDVGADFVPSLARAKP
jgi:dimethylamine/trimethylamine dehydrogenase